MSEDGIEVTGEDFEGRPCSYCGETIDFAEWQRDPDAAVTWDIQIGDPETGETDDAVARHYFCSQECKRAAQRDEDWIRGDAEHGEPDRIREEDLDDDTLIADGGREESEQQTPYVAPEVPGHWYDKALQNVEEWGLQDKETLLLAMQEELSELTQAVLEAREEDGDQDRIDDELDDLGALLFQFHMKWEEQHERTCVYCGEGDDAYGDDTAWYKRNCDGADAYRRCSPRP